MGRLMQGSRVSDEVRSQGPHRGQRVRGKSWGHTASLTQEATEGDGR